MEDSVSYLVSGAFTSSNHRNDFTDTHKKRQSRIDIFQSTQKCLLSKANSSIDKRHRIITKYYYTDVKVNNSLLKVRINELKVDNNDNLNGSYKFRKISRQH